jgi:uncharacterized protein (TIGR00369 family)
MGRSLKLQDDSFCFVCGRDNPCGLKLAFTNVNGRVVSEFTPAKVYQGYTGITHGGIISTVLDEAMIYAAMEDGTFPVTAELTVRFKKPLMTDETAIIEAEVINSNSKLATAHSRLIRKHDGALIAEGSAKLLK